MGNAALVIWMNGQRVGTWSVLRGTHQFAYEAAWLERAAEARPLSLSLPLHPSGVPHRGAMVEHYFDNLLPDSRLIRERIGRRMRTDSLSCFDLLSAVGRDCVGAVQLLPAGSEPEGVHELRSQVLSDGEVERLIELSLSARMPTPEDENRYGGFRFSLAGAQEKVALLKHEGSWRLPLGATPSTHILKLPMGLVGGTNRIDMSSSLENEWLCLRIMEGFGIPAPKSELLQFGQQRVLAVERFDRRLLAQGWIARLPQEDLCQAFGLPGHQKYENDGGPGLSSILALLRGSACAEQDRLRFLKTLLIFWLLLATDGHAKNFSVFLERQGAFRLTPCYDVLSFWPYVGKGPGHPRFEDLQMSMALRTKNVHYGFDRIGRRHWEEVAQRNGLVGGTAMIDEVLASVPRVANDLGNRLPSGFPSSVAEPVLAGLQTMALRLGS